MVAAIEFAVRSSAGGTQHGSVAGDGQSNFIQIGAGDSVSLNLARSSIVAYEQQGNDLLIKLADGRTVVLSGYFNETGGVVNHLYLSSDSQITEVIVDGTGNGLLYADYGPVQGWEKWSPLDDLRFANADGVTEMAVASNEPAGMAPLIPGLLGGLGGVGAAAAVAGGAAIIAGGGSSSSGDGDGNGDGRTPPAVDPQDADPLTTNTNNPVITVTGTGEPGDAVLVDIDGHIEETTIDDDGTWTVTFPEDNLPEDGTHVAEVTVTQPDGTETELTGPTFVVDMTPPDVATTFGTTANNDIENLAEYANGISLGGTGEAGATVSVLVNGHTQTTTIGSNGQWTVTFSQSQIAGGDYHTVSAVITATDPLGNQTVINRDIAIDTVPHPITVTNVAGDNVVNLAESDGGFAVTGTSTPGAVMTVTIGSVTRTVTTGATGSWTANFAADTVTTDGNASVQVSTVDAAGNASSTTFPFKVDTTATLAVNTVAGNDLVNKSEAGGVITITGTSEIGSHDVMVSWNGTALPATVNPTTGAWSVDFPANLFGSTQMMATTVSVTATDAYGNSSTATRSVNVDTLVNVDVADNQIGGDDRMAMLETGGFNLTGTADAGASVRVTFEGQTVTVTASASGTWTAPFGFGSFGQMTRDGVVQVTATDTAGNTASTTHTIHIDTEVKNFRLTAVDDLSSLAAGADAVNAAEALNGVTITGTVEPFSTVTLSWGGTALAPIVVGANGVWTAVVPASAVPAGETFVTVTATARDQYGNASGTLTQLVEIDRVVQPLTRSGGQIGGDGRINAEEAAAGVTLTGTVEAGSTVFVKINGSAAVQTTATANGTWSITVPRASLPEGDDVPMTVQVSATDWVGNTRELAAETVRIDTVAPIEANITKDTGEGNIISAILTAGHGNAYGYHAVDSAGDTTVLDATLTNLTKNGVPLQQAWFDTDIPDGTYLVVSNEDAAGNQASTLYLRNTTGPVTVDLTRDGLQEFDFGTINLSAADATLTIREADILNLTGADKQLTVVGGTDDVVNIAGAVEVSSGVPAGFKLYNLGSHGASVLIEDDIVVNTTGV
jgi:large repetitive protein